MIFSSEVYCDLHSHISCHFCLFTWHFGDLMYQWDWQRIVKKPKTFIQYSQWTIISMCFWWFSCNLNFWLWKYDELSSNSKFYETRYIYNFYHIYVIDKLVWLTCDWIVNMINSTVVIRRMYVCLWGYPDYWFS